MCGKISEKNAGILHQLHIHPIYLYAALHIFPLAIHVYLHAMLPYLILFKSCGKRCTQATDAHPSNANKKNTTSI